MKTLFVWKTLTVLAVLAGILLLGVPAPAQQPSSGQAQMGQQPAQQPDTMSPSDAKSFTGKIVKAGGKLVLKDNASKSTYQLDDQDKAKSFEGKQVKVNGTLDPATGTIHVTSIEPAA